MAAPSNDHGFPESGEDSEDPPLSAKDRWISGVFGGVAFVTGVVAVFVSKTEVGAGVLLAIGALFMLMAATGRPITSAKFGDNQIRLARRLIKQTESTLDNAPPDVRAEVAEAVLAAAPAEWRPLTVKARAVVFENRLVEELKELLPNASGKPTIRTVPGP